MIAAAAGLLALCGGCRPHPGANRASGDPPRILRIGNGTEPHDLDPDTIQGIPELNILIALEESLIVLDPATLQPLPGVATHWEISADGTVYTFHLRPEAKWSDGDPLTAQDFVDSYRRVLSPTLGAPFAYIMYVLKNAEAFNKGQLTDFEQVGVHALDAHTLQLTLHDPTPYFFAILYRQYFMPVKMSTVHKYGDPYAPGNTWASAGHFVGNGPYRLAQWKVNQQIVVDRNPYYWDAAHVALDEIHFFPIDDISAEENAFRAGQLDITSQVSPDRIGWYRRVHPEELRIDPYVGIYYFMLNTQAPALRDVRVRRALAMSIDRDSIVRNVARGGQEPAHCFTPPATGYRARAAIPTDIPAAQKLLADAGFPGGAGLPPIRLLINTSESHRQIAEAVQEMWRKALGVHVEIQNEEWKVYLDSRKTMNYQICRAGFISYKDPSGFLDNMLTGGPNNQTGFGDPEYDRLIHEAGRTGDPAARMEIFQRAEALLLEAAPIIPVYFYTNAFLIHPYVQGWVSNEVDYHLYQRITLKK